MRSPHIFCLLALFTVILPSYAQIKGSNQIPNFNRMPGGYAFNESNIDPYIKSVTEPIGMIGSPYLFEKAIPSKIVFADTSRDTIELNLNYNLYVDFMKIEDENNPSDKIELLPRGWNYDILMGERRFRFISFSHGDKEVNAHVEILDTYEDGSFLALQRIKTIKEGLLGVKDRFVDTEYYYYIRTDGSSLELQNDYESVLNGIPEQFKTEIKNFIAANNIRFEENLRGLKGVIRYYAQNSY